MSSSGAGPARANEHARIDSTRVIVYEISAVSRTERRNDADRLRYTDQELAGLLDAAPEGSGLSAIDAEQLLVRQGWHWLRCRVVGLSQQVAVCIGADGARAPLHLTPREFQTLALFARGLMAKHIAGELSTTEATVRGTLSRMLQKLDLTSGAQLPALWRAMTGRVRSFSPSSTQLVLVFACELVPRDGVENLTLAERAILTSILEGRSNRAIARSRGTSERTIANQIATLLRKFRVSSRRELTARLLDTDGETTMVHDSMAAVPTIKMTTMK